jgi:hypothetical protein
VFGRKQSLAKIRHYSGIFRREKGGGVILRESKEIAFRIPGLRAET